MTELTELAIQARRNYLKNWREKNKDKCKEYKARYWEKRAKRQMSEVNRNDDSI